ncbi:hypothetical protein [Cohnella nanjingensis]|uniref:Uncharacterized protein n=1 Tax=Cohnella nanjingensis TaxID=1387779 RepID=A0A7X0RSD0_9BACL|nr:hypothetical protein [Cohnella nanjingensis]MBB6672807.1 hypothetical protein [Cohnella nanjingensis]
MLKKLGLASILIALAAAIAVLYYTYPRHRVLHAQGLLFQLGEDHASFAQPIAIDADGTLRRSLNGSKTFRGTFKVDEGADTHPMFDQPLTIRFDAKGRGTLLSADFRNGRPIIQTYGDVFIDGKMSRVAIAKYVMTGVDATQKGWSGADGLMIAAPAADRTAGLRVVNELTGRFWRDHTFR